MKDKKQKITVIFGIICAVIIGVCLVIQFVIKKEDKKLQKGRVKKREFFHSSFCL